MDSHSFSRYYKTMVYPEKYKKDIELAISYLKKLSVGEVYLFGSIVTGATTLESDIDIAVRGMDSMDFFLAIAELQGLLVHEFDSRAAASCLHSVYNGY